MSTILHSVQTKMDFLKKKIYCYFGRKVKHPSKGMVYLLKEQFIFCMDIVPAKAHCIAPQEGYSY